MGTDITNANIAIAAALIVALPVLLLLIAFSRQIIRGKHGEKPEIPMIVRGGDFPNNGAFFTIDTMCVQNEDTDKMTNLLEKVSYAELLNGLQQPPKSPQESLASIEVASDLQVELVASEPLLTL